MLLYMSEEETFWTFTAMLRYDANNMNTHNRNQEKPKKKVSFLFTPGLPLTRMCLFQFTYVLNQIWPDLGDHLKNENLDADLYAMNFS